LKAAYRRKIARHSEKAHAATERELQVTEKAFSEPETGALNPVSEVGFSSDCSSHRNRRGSTFSQHFDDPSIIIPPHIGQHWREGYEEHSISVIA